MFRRFPVCSGCPAPSVSFIAIIADQARPSPRKQNAPLVAAAPASSVVVDYLHGTAKAFVKLNLIQRPPGYGAREEVSS